MVGSWTTVLALVLAASVKFYPNHEFLWERPAVDAGPAGRIIGRRVNVNVGQVNYDQETYLGELVQIY